MLNIHPSGFLAELHVLSAPTLQQFTCHAAENDFHDAEEEELLLPHTLQQLVTDGEIASSRAFLGALSITGTSIAAIRCVSGEEAIAQLRISLNTFGKPESAVADCLPCLLELSNDLKKLADDGVVVVRPALSSEGPLLQRA